MKRVILSFLTCFCLIASNANSQETKPEDELIAPPGIFVGIGSVINEYGVLGIGIEKLVIKKFSVSFNVGIGSWGWKLGGGAQYYFSQPGYGSALNLGYGFASGLSDFETEVGVGYNNEKKNVVFDLMSVNTINIGYSYNIKAGRMNKLVITTGYSIPLATERYKVKSGEELSNQGKDLMKLVEPGGLILGVKFMFGAK